MGGGAEQLDLFGAPAAAPTPPAPAPGPAHQEAPRLRVAWVDMALEWREVPATVQTEVLACRDFLLRLLAGARDPLALAGLAGGGEYRWEFDAQPGDYPAVAAAPILPWDAGA